MIFIGGLALSTAEQQATLVQCEAAPPDRHGHNSLTSMLMSLLLLSTIYESAESLKVQRQTSAAGVFELPLPWSMVSRARKVGSLSDGILSIISVGTE